MTCMSDSGGANFGPSAAKEIVEKVSKNARDKHRIEIDSNRKGSVTIEVLIMVAIL